MVEARAAECRAAVVWVAAESEMAGLMGIAAPRAGAVMAAAVYLVEAVRGAVALAMAARAEAELEAVRVAVFAAAADLRGVEELAGAVGAGRETAKTAAEEAGVMDPASSAAGGGVAAVSAMVEVVPWEAVYAVPVMVEAVDC